MKYKQKQFVYGLDYYTPKGYRSIVFSEKGARDVFARYHKLCKIWSMLK